MKRWLRGAIGMGMTWAVGWAAGGMVVRLVVGSGTDDVPLPIRLGLIGFLAGLTFAAVLGVVGRRRRFEAMSPPRFAGWGGVGGLVLFGALAATAGAGGEPLWLAPLLAVGGAGSAAGTLAIARRAEGGPAGHPARRRGEP